MLSICIVLHGNIKNLDIWMLKIGLLKNIKHLNIKHLNIYMLNIVPQDNIKHLHCPAWEY
jgi:hypothetical protein